jgi:hypothetical protein
MNEIPLGHHACCVTPQRVRNGRHRSGDQSPLSKAGIDFAASLPDGV